MGKPDKAMINLGPERELGVGYGLDLAVKLTVASWKIPRCSIGNTSSSWGPFFIASHVSLPEGLVCFCLVLFVFVFFFTDSIRCP